METKEYRTVDKSTWGDGPWMSEPDELSWIDPETELLCVIVRSQTTGSLCGYVGIPNGHNASQRRYEDVTVDVHGGLTYANFNDRFLCIVKQKGEAHENNTRNNSLHGGHNGRRRLGKLVCTPRDEENQGREARPLTIPVSADFDDIQTTHSLAEKNMGHGECLDFLPPEKTDPQNMLHLEALRPQCGDISEAAITLSKGKKEAGHSGDKVKRENSAEPEDRRGGNEREIRDEEGNAKVERDAKIKTKQGEYWFLGFDTAHHMDRSPALEATLRSIGSDPSYMAQDSTYRDLAYVENEVRSLAKQLKAMA